MKNRDKLKALNAQKALKPPPPMMVPKSIADEAEAVMKAVAAYGATVTKDLPSPMPPDGAYERVMDRVNKHQVAIGSSIPDIAKAPPPLTGKYPAKHRPKFKEPFRLPDGAMFTANYKAESTEWTVTLTVPGHPMLEWWGSALHPTIMKVGQMWREKYGEK